MDKLEREQLKKIYNTMPGAFFIYGAKTGEIYLANDALVHLWGCEDEASFLKMTDGTIKGMIHPDDYQIVLKQIALQSEEKDALTHVVCRRANSTEDQYMEGYGKLIHDDQRGDYYTVEVTKSYRNSEMLDSLTGLMNIRHFLDELSKKKAQLLENEDIEEHALVFFNFVNFKFFNASYGMEAGDKFLKNTAVLLEKIFDHSLVGRFSDDHFIVFTKKEHLKERLNSFYYDIMRTSYGGNVRLQAGIRYLSHNDVRVSPAIACDQAKIACDCVKQENETFYRVYDNDLHQQFLMKNYIVENIDKAIALGYIQVYYQPVIRTYTKELCGCEALARWNDPIYGLLSPNSFIPVLEETHLIYKLDYYIMQCVAKELRRKMDLGMTNVPISFNISRYDFYSSDPLAVLESIVAQYRLKRELLCCEITETALIHNKTLLKKKLDCLKDKGYALWMDDFGSGYSSLNF